MTENKIDKFLKIWFFLALSILLFFSAWLIKLVIYKVSLDNQIYTNLIKYLPYLIFFSSILILIRSKRKIFILIFFSIYSGFLVYDFNYNNFNFRVETYLKSNSIVFNLIQKSKIIFKKNKKNEFDLSEIYLDGSFKNNILLRQDSFPDIYVLNNKFKLKKIINKNTSSNALPLLIKENNNGYELTYFDYSNLNKVKLNKNFNVVRYLWKKKYKTVFHHWGDLYDNKLYILGSNTQSFPNEKQELYNNNFRNCKNGWFLNETIEVINYSDGSLIKRVELLDKLSSIKEVNNLNYNLICQDPSHSNDVRVIKDKKIANFFPKGRVGDLLISVRHFNSIILLDKDSFEVKWHITGKTEWQHSPKITSDGTIFVFDNLGSNPINGKSRLVSIDIKTKKIIGIYESDNFEDFFESESGGRIQIYKNKIYVIETNKANMFSLDCANLIKLKKCKKKVVFHNKIKSDLFFAHVF